MAEVACTDSELTWPQKLGIVAAVVLVVVFVVACFMLSWGPASVTVTPGADELEAELESYGLVVLDKGSSDLKVSILVDDSCRVELLARDVESSPMFVYAPATSYEVAWAVDERLANRLESLCSTTNALGANGGES